MQVLKLKEILKNKGITGKELAKRANVTEASISKLSKGDSIPRKDLLIAISEILDVDIKDLFYSTKKDSKKIQVIINDELKTFHSVKEFKEFANNQ